MHDKQENLTPNLAEAEWVSALAKFLGQGVEAIRVDPATHSIAIASLGRVDLERLQQQLVQTIEAIETQLEVASGEELPVIHSSQGFVVRRSEHALEVAENRCQTAASLWTWHNLDWPEIQAMPIEKAEWRKLTVCTLLCAVFGIIGTYMRHGEIPYWWIAYLVSIVAGSWDAAHESWENLREKKFDIHFLMLMVALGAICVNAWGEATLLLFLFSASSAMESYAMDRTQQEIGSLLKNAPKTALLVLDDGSEQSVDIEGLRILQIVRVKPGDAFPADGVVLQGESASDESNLTGEALPVEKGKGDRVFSGTINLWGMVDVQVLRLPSESTLQKMIHLIQTAQKLRAPSERFTDRFGNSYTHLVLALCSLMFLIWWLVGGSPAFVSSATTHSAFYKAMTLLVVLSPCALVLSIPSAILAGIAKGAKQGILFRGGAAIEQLATLNLVALDKTGTLTTGDLMVESCESFPPGGEAKVMELAYALESNSQHPLARAIVRHAQQTGVIKRDVVEFYSMTGQGLTGKVIDSDHESQTVFLGRRELLEQGPLAEWAQQLPAPSKACTEVWVIRGDLVGRILLKDQVRLESSNTLKQLRSIGIRTVMLTGDHHAAAESIAEEIGLDEVRSGLSPRDKMEAMHQFRQEGYRVAMVGDGVNDAPCLAAADIGLAMGARGSDAALEQADIILMHDRIENVLAAFRLSQRVRKIIRQNLTISLIVISGMMLASIAGLIPLWLGVVAHEGSTVIVCLNSLRILLGKQSTHPISDIF